MRTQLGALAVRAAAAALLMVASASAHAQTAAATPARPDSARINRTGPRLGLVLLTPGDVSRAKISSRLSTVFAWQTETDFAAQPGGASGVTAMVVAVAGVEQQQFLPSISWLIGFRDRGGFEAGLGPNLNLEGITIGLAVGYTSRSGTLAIPVNLAVVPNKSGARVSLTFGFNTM